MLKKIFLLLWVLLIPKLATATHIVGGEFELRNLIDSTFELNLNIYFDAVNGNPGAVDDAVTVIIFSKATNQQKMSITMPLFSDTYVNYSAPSCAIGSLSTRKLRYKKDIILLPSSFNEPQGYYVTWERCCRNNTIQNIVQPGATGQAFYLEFPPLMLDGKRLKNSSPRIFPPLSDYACKGKPFFFEFGGSDLDGDSLVYELALPLAGYSTANTPAPLPRSAPYPTVTFVNGLSLNNMIAGTPPLAINSKTGLLTLTPKDLGLFVFSMKCTEYRKGAKIGVVVRDFQLLVVNCPNISPPAIVRVTDSTNVKLKSDTVRYFMGQSIYYKLTVRDPNLNQKLGIKMEPVNFTDPSLVSFDKTSGSTNGLADSLYVKMFLPKCPNPKDKFYVMDIIAFDNSCAKPLQDTLRLYVEVLPIPNEPPTITVIKKPEHIFVNSDTLRYAASKNRYCFDILVKDKSPGATLSFRIAPINFTLDNSLLSLDKTSAVLSASDSVKVGLCLPSCPLSDKKYFIFDFVVEETDCNIKYPTKKRMVVEVVPEPDNAPMTTTSLSNDILLDKYDLTVDLPNKVQFNVKSFDINADSIQLSVFGSDFNLADFGMVFQPKSGKGSLESQFSWVTDCKSIRGLGNNNLSDKYVLNFVTTDFNDCLKSRSDTFKVSLNVFLNRIPNNKPVLSINNSSSPVQSLGKCYYTKINVDQTLKFDVLADDFNKDMLVLEGEGVGYKFSDYKMKFTPASGRAPQTGNFEWTVECAFLNPDASSKIYEVRFIAYDSKECQLRATDTLCLKIEVFNVEQPISGFKAVNVFSPNGDGVNDTYKINADKNLPRETCDLKFEYIEIYNRWGKKVFRSEIRDFEWDATGFPSDEYFYHIKFSKPGFSYKGSIYLVRGQKE